jgi:hypothetical protein
VASTCQSSREKNLKKREEKYVFNFEKINEKREEKKICS